MFGRKSCDTSTLVDYIRNHRVQTTAAGLATSLSMMYVQSYLAKKKLYLESLLVGNVESTNSAHESSTIDEDKAYGSVKEFGVKWVSSI
jgi:hypothetical protein